MTLPPPIPAVFSKKANPDAVSFLDFSPEVRNRVYDFLGLEHAEPLLVTSWSDEKQRDNTSEKPAAYQRVTDRGEGWKPVDRRHDLPDNLQYPTDHKYFPTKDHGKLERVYHPAMNLLLSCRQVFAEAGSVLYSASTFNFIGRHTRTSLFECRQWIELLGLQSGMLRKLVIDKSASTKPWSIPPQDLHVRLADDFKQNARRGCCYVDIGPLVKLLWRCHFDNLSIEFKAVGATASVSAKEDAARMTVILQAFRNDDLGIKAFSSSIEQIIVGEKGRHGAILYSTTYTQAPVESSADDCEYQKRTTMWGYFHEKNLGGSYAVRQFTLENGKDLQYQARPPAGLLQLPPHVLDRIVDLVAPPQSGARINIVKRQTNLEIGLAHTNRHLRDLYWNKVMYRPTTLEVSSSKNPFPSETFEALRPYCRDATAFSSWWSHTRDWQFIDLCFDLTEPVTLDDLQFEVGSFLMATIDSYNAQVRIVVRTMDDSATWKETSCTLLTLNNLRHEARRALIWATDRPSGGYRPEMAKLYFWGFKENAEVLSLYMNGHGLVTGLKSTVSSAIVEVPGPDIFVMRRPHSWDEIFSEFDGYKNYQKWEAKEKRLNPHNLRECWSSMHLIQRMTWRLP